MLVQSTAMFKTNAYTHSENDPVTMVIARQIKPGHEADFERWISELTDVVLTFPGHMGLNVIRPIDRKHPEYVVIFRFDNYANLKNWAESDVRRAWVDKIAPIIVGEPKQHTITGMEFWFTPAPDVAFVPPPRHKMAAVTWLAIFPLSFAVGSVVSQPLADLGAPPLVRSMVTAALLVILMTYLVMPTMTRLFAFWLKPK